MSSADVILAIVVVTALAFDFTNGFHDTANVAATAISTRAIAPRPAVALAALLNFVGAFISLKVAATVGKGFVDVHVVTTTVVFAGLIGAIGWNLLTWYFGLPSSSSHALIGGLVGAVWAAHGSGAVSGGGLVDKLIVPAVVAPLVAFLAAGLAILLVYRIVGRLRPGPVNRGLPPRPARLQRAAGALARDQRRPEDDGADHAGAGGSRLDQGRPRSTCRCGW